MTLKIDPAQLRHLRLRAQGLAAPVNDLRQLLTGAVSLQAQDYNAAVLGVRARSCGLVDEDVREALIDGDLCWTWLMRGTLHLVTMADLPWLLPLFGPQFIRLTARRYRELGLDEEARGRATSLLRQILADGPQTRAALKDKLAAEGLPVEGQACPHLLRHAALEGALVCVPLRNSRPEYRLLDDRAMDGWPGSDEAAARLSRRFLRAFGPANAADLARWSGLPMQLARAGLNALADEVTAIKAAGQEVVIPNGQLPWLDDEPRRSLFLLPAFDALLLSHVDRDLVLPPEVSRAIHPGGGIIRPSLLIDGVVRGRWQLKRGRRSLTVIVTPFVPVPRGRLPQLEAEVEDIGRFLGRAAVMKLEEVAA
ncbi:MAG: winged helix DNA-binding domain-containing protein [Anaerolineaceae bacterium]|nr:winged helix DNA-binding domain-containing protein [Anaerolineaceae bacterium]